MTTAAVQHSEEAAERAEEVAELAIASTAACWHGMLLDLLCAWVSEWVDYMVNADNNVLDVALRAMFSATLSVPASASFEALHAAATSVPLCQPHSLFSTHTTFELPCDYGCALHPAERRGLSDTIHCFTLDMATARPLNERLVRASLAREAAARSSSADGTVHAGVHNSNYGGFQSQGVLFDEIDTLGERSQGAQHERAQVEQGEVERGEQRERSQAEGAQHSCSQDDQAHGERAQGDRCFHELHAIASSAMDRLVANAAAAKEGAANAAAANAAAAANEAAAVGSEEMAAHCAPQPHVCGLDGASDGDADSEVGGAPAATLPAITAQGTAALHRAFGWVNINRSSDLNFMHVHDAQMWSGVYFVHGGEWESAQRANAPVVSVRDGDSDAGGGDDDGSGGSGDGSDNGVSGDENSGDGSDGKDGGDGGELIFRGGSQPDVAHASHS
jgi:hypothetical protein